MNKLILLTVLFSLNSFAQRGNAIESGDLFKAKCTEPISREFTTPKIVSLLKGKGQNVTKLLKDPNFKSYHIREIYQAVLLMPRWMRISQVRLKDQILYKTDYKLDGVAMYGNSILTINPKRWFEYTSDKRVAIIFHELAHTLSDAFSRMDSADIWKDVDGGWIKHNHGLEPHDYTSHTSQYSTTNYFEDFAESVSAYRIDPSYLKKISIKKYNFIKETIFLGQEFLSDKDCAFNIKGKVNFSKIENTLRRELNKGKIYKLTYEGLAQRTRYKYHPKAIERIFYKRAIMLYILQIGNKFQSTKEDYILKAKYRAYYLNSRSLNGLMSGKSKVYINKLKRNPNIVRRG